MPEFELPIGSGSGREWLKSLDLFTRGYVEAMFFADVREEELPDASVSDLSADARKQIVDECALFQQRYEDDLTEAYDSGRIDDDDEKRNYDEEMAGRDFWYTRQGHGVGYWCRDLGDIGDTLAKHCSGWRALDLYKSKNGQIHFA